MVAVTKTDLADPELAALEAGELLPGAEAVAVSARTGAGLDELRAALDRAARERAGADAEPATRAARLHIDRVFTIRGAGTVVTGTLWSGAIARGDALGAAARRPAGPRPRGPGARRAGGAARPPASGWRSTSAASRVAEVARGDVLGAAGRRRSQPTYRLDAELRVRRRGARATATGSRSTTARARRRPGWPGWAAASGSCGSSRR